MDSESQAELRLRWSGGLQREYQEMLERHNLQLKSFCHQAGIHYSLFVTGEELSEFILETLPSVGLFK